LRQSQPQAAIRLGLRENLPQFALLLLANAFVGAMIGQERTVLPLIAEQEFAIASRTVVLSFILSFGIVKAVANLIAGRLADLAGRKVILIVGWVIGLPAPFILMWAPSWKWIVFANVLLGIQQGLCWSLTVIMKIDLVGPGARGLAMGLNEFTGYLAVGASALATGYIANTYGLRPEPFYVGGAVVILGLVVSLLFIKDTKQHASFEAGLAGTNVTTPSFLNVVLRTSWKDRTLFSCSQAGMVNNLNDGLAWGLFPLYFAAAGLSLSRIAVLSAIYPGIWSVTQLLTGALSDRFGRKWMIVGGMIVQAAGLWIVAAGSNFTTWLVGSILLGLGTAMVYPTLLAAVSDVAHPGWRASTVGVYRLWRDGGYAVGALVAGFVADFLGIRSAIVFVGFLTLASGLLAASLMRETLPQKQ
jgi:MFS family permease